MSEGGQVGVIAHPRRNGWSCTPHPLQILIWCAILVLAVLHYGVLVFYIPGLWRILGYVVPGILLVFLVVAVVMTTSIDPSEEQVRQKVRRGHRLRPAFDRSVHKHVIENRHCNLCQVDVSASAKHCRVCDKCIHDFDHHCKWMNNCIGGRNYRWFMATLVLGLTGTILLLLFSLSLFILFFADRDSLRYDCDRPSNVTSCNDALRLFGAVVPDAVFPALTGVLCLVTLAGTPAISHLLVFHLYLLSKGISTYDYIVMQREGERDKGGDEGRHHGRCSALRAKVNQVSPASHLNEVEEGGEVETASVGSAGMVNFGRTPPPSEGSESSGECAGSKTKDLKMEAVTDWAYGKDECPRGNSKEQRLEVVSSEANANHNNSTDVGGGRGQLDGTQPDSPSPPREEGGAGGGEDRPSVSLEGAGQPCPAAVQESVDGLVGCDEVKDGTMEGGSEGEVEQLPLLATPSSSPPDGEGKKSGVAVDSSTTSEGGKEEKVVLCDGGTPQSLEDRHKELKARVLQDMAVMDSRLSVTPPPFAISPLAGAESTNLEQFSQWSLHSNLDPPSPLLSSYDPHKRNLASPRGTSSPLRDHSLQEVPLSSLRDLTKSPDELSTGIGSFRSSTPSLLTKHRVSFENIETEQSVAISPRPLPPLPPIGSTGIPYETRTIQRAGGGAVGGEAPPRGPPSRPLPPLSIDDLVGSQESLLSAPSSLLFPSTNSLPQPDPRYSYRRLILQPIASSNLSLDAAGARRARVGRKGGRGTMEGGRTSKEGSHHPDDQSSPSPLS